MHYPRAGKLIVHNTPENQLRVEKILQELNITPTQVSIEAKFVEVKQTDLSSLGFEWSMVAGGVSFNRAAEVGGQNYLNDEYSGHNTGVGNKGDNFQLGIGKEPSITSGLRFAESMFGGSSDTLFNVYSILGNYAFNTVVHALEQESHSDVLSAPKITTISGTTAQIKVVTVHYFPESWTAPELGAAEGDSGARDYTPSMPEFGDGTDIGVILDVTPTVSADGYSIDIELSPQVIDFLEYETSFNTNMIVSGQPLEVKYNMPILSKREAYTKLVVWDGETVVLGGMIQERLEKYNDRVPFLGRVPLLGRLFSSKGEKSVKTNLLIFVNARLVNPEGLPIRANDLRGLPDFRH